MQNKKLNALYYTGIVKVLYQYTLTIQLIANKFATICTSPNKDHIF